ncbi:aminotransferase class V-fold PLP-dependent enzyme [Ornithinimicrobium pratense]|uniref:Alanine--glyoxylate aminotransferase family protein n=1 Tax=Ornithinimicrobium pratense TaxID=2593973 RepID=A0A5J6V5K3_9MICO|nr:aminotransferase class V-fold PLP-dependent enzyme [Ornithinimicrobium pratense]QFG68292.1 alanine--glyoxylate aminotransferase family protein [Ornithinimicrobium pratense]
MQLPHPDIDPDGLVEFSVVFTDRSLNHMSARFVSSMQSLLEDLRTTYSASSVALVPGGGSYAMESVARQVATGKPVLVLRNGLFSYRWSQILEAGAITQDVTVLKAAPVDDAPQAAWAPAPIEEVVAAIERTRPAVVFAPHVETASGILLPDDYLRAVADATHEAGGIFVLDCVASGPLWVDMETLGVDVLVSAPQKGWSGTPATGYVLLRERGRAAVEAGTSTSFALDLRAWLDVSDAYVTGATPYRATLPTDAIARNAEVARETVERGLEPLRKAQEDLGGRVRALLAERGFASVAAPEYAAPTVVVVHTEDPEIQSGAAFKPLGLQVAAGVPLFCGEREGWSTVRLGLFGLDKLDDVDATVARLKRALDQLSR